MQKKWQNQITFITWTC